MMQIMVALSLAGALGCAGAPKPQTSVGVPKREPPGGDCEEWGCGHNGRRAHGTVDDRAARVEGVR